MPLERSLSVFRRSYSWSMWCCWVALWAVLLPSHGAAAGPPTAGVAESADGLILDAEGHPHYATFSLCAIDPDTGEAGVAVTTRVPFVGRAVPWVRAGVGAVATQAWTVVEYGHRGLDLMAAGTSPEDALAQLLADDVGRQRRQIGMIDMQGRTASHTGSGNGPWAGGRQGKHYTVQGNVLVGRQVVDAVGDHFESTDGSGMPLAERMILALEAGQDQGGDKRWGYFQSAAIRIADPNDPGRGGDNISLAIEVGEHQRPVAELKRIYYTTQRRLGYREFSEVRGPDVLELKRWLHRLGYWGKDLESFPAAPEFDGDRSLMRSDPAAFEAQIDAYRQRAQAHDDAYAVYDGVTRDAVQQYREDHDLDFVGNPRGLVDRRLVDALRRDYMESMRPQAYRPAEEPAADAAREGGSGDGHRH